MDNQRIVAVEWARLHGRRPRKATGNSRKDGSRKTSVTASSLLLINWSVVATNPAWASVIVRPDLEAKLSSAASPWLVK